VELEGVVARVPGEPDLDEAAEDGGETSCEYIGEGKGHNLRGMIWGAK
jgi:hypothetical protein